MSVLTDLFAKLYADSTLGGLLDKYTASNYPAIFTDPVAPVDFLGQEHIVLYRSGQTFHDESIFDQIITANCRGATIATAEAIRQRVIVLVNRHKIASGVFGLVAELPVIRPQDETDNYNCPVEIRVKSKEA
jgi:hypothetical protein